MGGTVGGYITFSGVHRLLDAGVKGLDSQAEVTRSAISGIVISTIMRFVLFLAIVGVLSHGAVLDADNPAAGVFRSAAGEVGSRIFGVILWSAAISSVVGAVYTSVSFFKTFHPVFARYERACISVFIMISTGVFVLVGKPAQLLVFARLSMGSFCPWRWALCWWQLPAAGSWAPTATWAGCWPPAG